MKSISDVDTVAQAVSLIGQHGAASALKRSSSGWLSEFVTTDGEAERAYLGAVYGTALSFDGIEPGGAVGHRHGAATGFIVDEISIRDSARLQARPRSGVMIALVVDGAVRIEEVAVEAGESYLADSRHGWSATVQTGTIRLVTVEAWLMQRAADESATSDATAARDLTMRPVTRELGDAWTRSVNYAVETMDARAPRVLVDAAGRMLAAAVLACFAPASTSAQTTGQHADLPAPLRSAMAYIAAGAREAIGIQEIAAAVHLSPRAVQYLFRKYLDETPTEHLRRVRLQSAHLELAAGHPSTATVAGVARRWGFSHTGRFAAVYRETFGVSPHVTLRGQ